MTRLSTLRAASALLISLLPSAFVQAEPTNFRVGAGLFSAHIDPAEDYMPKNDDYGLSVFAEMPQSDYLASRFMLYRTQTKDTQLSGFETQMMIGYGLSKPGFRIYTGPGWHREKIEVERNNDTAHRIFNGWGWHVGLGYQYQAVTLDLSASLRDNADYYSENKRIGSDKEPNAYVSNLLISYRF